MPNIKWYYGMTLKGHQEDGYTDSFIAETAKKVIQHHKTVMNNFGSFTTLTKSELYTIFDYIELLENELSKQR